MKKLAILCFATAAAASQAIMIDQFSSGTVASSLSSGTRVLTQVAAVPSGERDVEMRVLANPFNQFLDFEVNAVNGFAIVSNGFGIDSIISLQYDRPGDETVGTGQVLNNGGNGVSLGLNGDTVRVNFRGNDLPVSVTATTRLNGVITSTNNAVKAGGGPGSLDIFLGAAPLAAADSITIAFAAQTSGDFSLESIETVPEPATLAALGIGAAAMLRRRKK